MRDNRLSIPQSIKHGDKFTRVALHAVAAKDNSSLITPNGRNTIDTFYLMRIMSLNDHPTYVLGRKFVNKANEFSEKTIAREGDKCKTLTTLTKNGE